MTPRLSALCIAAHDPARLRSFWAELLGPELERVGFSLRFLPTDEPKTRQNQMHVDLTSTSLDGQQSTVARALELGARHVDVGQRPDEPHVVLADPEGNEFCVIEPGNNFLADCGFVGALACDGSQAVGYFWSEALGWPLVWDQDQETAIRSPHGGPKITWGGPPFAARTGRNRLHFDLAPPPGGDQAAEVERLLAMGASQIGVAEHEPDSITLADPDGNEFCLLLRP